MPGMDTPLIPITFEWTDWRENRPSIERDFAEARAAGIEPEPIGEPQKVERLWYHLPRIGDTIALTEDFAGTVKHVIWADDGVIVEIQ